ncbi:MAG TPA: NUDIX hydrolase [Spirochaetales bacterium]|nr:NUDIX hydrolase [Spirochaetales bacterium]
MSWKTIDSNTLIDSYHVKVKKDKVRLPDGAIIEDFYTLTIPDAAMVCAVTKEGNIILKSEYRYACGEEVIECPAGMFEPEENDPLTVAKRELLEETGYESDDWTYLGATWESTSKLTNRMHLFLANNAVKTSLQHLDENEHLDVIIVSLEEAVEMVMSGKINANSTVHLILKADRLLKGELNEL